MKIGIMQPYFFPYIGYWQLVNLVDEFVVFDDVNYIKKGWINRNRIVINDREQWINLFICNASQNRLIKDTKLMQTLEDNQRLLNTIKMAYHKAPYFELVYPLLKDILSYDSKDLSSFLLNQLKQVCVYLRIQTKMILSSDIPKKTELRGEEKILEICKKRNADHYINAIGGEHLYNKKKFNDNGIELSFLKTSNICYSQFKEKFWPDLSIIDVMMFNSTEKITSFLNQCILID